MIKINALKNLKVKRPLIIGLAVLLLIGVIFIPGRKKTEPQNTEVTNFTINSNDAEEDASAFQPRDFDSGYVPLDTPGEREKTKLRQSLPYNMEYQTSVGITTNINIYTIFSDPRDTIHVEIYGINYHNRETDAAKNPDVVAFKESFIKLNDVLKNMNVNLKDLNVIYGTNEFMHDTADFWIKFFNLL